MSKPNVPTLRRNAAQRGFTLVELVVVITILGILAAVALPRFLNMQADARRAKAEALYGAVRAAATQVRAATMVAGHTKPPSEGPSGPRMTGMSPVKSMAPIA